MIDFKQLEYHDAFVAAEVSRFLDSDESEDAETHHKK